jgi:hypothetical protein
MSDDWTDPPEAPASKPALPGSRIEVVEQNRNRLVLYIPGGGPNASSIGCFAFLWNGVVLAVTGGFAAAAMQPNGPPWFVFLFLLLFWAVGLGMAYWAIKLRHERTMLLVEPTRAVIQRTLFNRVRTDETELAESSSAGLVEAYRQNDDPVFAIHIRGPGRTLKFGTALSDGEKDWIIGRINTVLGVPGETDAEDAPVRTTVRYPEKCAQCGASLGPAAEANENHELICAFCGHVHRGQAVETPSHESLGLLSEESQEPAGPFPADRIHIEEQSADRLIFSMRGAENAGARYGMGCFLGSFALFWNAAVWTGLIVTLLFAEPWFVKLFAGLFLTPFVLIGAVVAFLASATLFGRIRISLDRDELAARWIVGPFRYTKRLPAADIDRVTVQYSPRKSTADRARRRRRSRSSEPQQLAVAWAGTKWIPLAIVHNTETARHVAKLLRDQFDAMNMPLDRARGRRSDDAAVDIPEPGEIG